MLTNLKFSSHVKVMRAAAHLKQPLPTGPVPDLSLDICSACVCVCALEYKWGLRVVSKLLVKALEALW